MEKLKEWESVYATPLHESSGLTIRGRLVEALILLDEAKKAKKDKKEVEESVPETEDILLDPKSDPLETAIEKVNEIITQIIKQLGTSHPAIDTLLTASRDLDKAKETVEDEPVEDEPLDEGQDESNMQDSPDQPEDVDTALQRLKDKFEDR